MRSAGLQPQLFGDVNANPTDVNVAAGARAFREHSADAVVAVGGGSGLDAGKSIAMVARSGVDLHAFDWTREPPVLGPGAIPPVVAVPTTAGTGAEMDSPSMITDTQELVKVCVTHPACDITVLADPLLTVSLPPHLTAWTGMDALTHALEAYFVAEYHPMCDGIALEAMRLIDAWLPKAVADGTDVEARSNMMAASSMAAVAFQKGLGAVHGLSEPIGAVADTQHGLTNAIVLPHVLRANRPAVRDKCDLAARYLGLPPPPPAYGAPGDAPGFEAVCCWVDRLLTQLDVPGSLADIGLDPSAVRALGVKAEANATGHTNPIRFTAADYERICHDALRGRDRAVF